MLHRISKRGILAELGHPKSSFDRVPIADNSVDSSVDPVVAAATLITGRLFK